MNLKRTLHRMGDFNVTIYITPFKWYRWWFDHTKPEHTGWLVSETWIALGPIDIKVCW